MKPARSVLSVPGHKPSMHGKASRSRADVVMLDLEDSVPVQDKEMARKTIRASVKDLDWQGKTLAVRINSLDTPFGFRDALEVAGAGEPIHRLVLPKVNNPGDIHFIDRLLRGIEMEQGMAVPMGIEAAVETARGLDKVSKIARASNRLVALSFGVADYTASVGAGLVSISGHGENEDRIYPGQRWHFPVSRMVMAAKANGLAALDAPYGDFKDMEGLAASAFRAKALGCDGKWAIHPDQIPVINRIFSPTSAEIARAKIILDAAARSGPGQGAVAVEGKMVDRATVRLASNLLDKARFLKLV